MTDLYKQIADVHKTVSGWCSWEKAQTLASIVLGIRPAITIEVGVWFGRSLFPMALAHKAVGRGVVYAVDPWLPGCSVAGQHGENAEWWNNVDSHNQAYAGFIAMRSALDLKHVIPVHRMHSDEFDIPEGVSLLHVDGNHGPQAIRDIERYCPKVVVGGIVVVDDLHWDKGNVTAAVQKMMSMGFQELYVVDDAESKNQWGVYQKVK